MTDSITAGPSAGHRGTDGTGGTGGTGGATRVPSFSRLVGMEFRRLSARRFVRVVGVLAVLGFLAAVLVTYARHERVDRADLAQATRARNAEVTQINRETAQCSKGLTPRQIRNRCGTPVTRADIPVKYFVHNTPFAPDRVTDYAGAIGVATALLGFVVGATVIGAEWSSKNFVALLFWEPRRLRVMAAKLLALVTTVLLGSAIAQVAWFGIAHLLLSLRGLPVSSLGPAASGFWSHVATMQVRDALLVVPAAVLAFGLASLMRNTAAAFGVGFVYFALLETALRNLVPDWQGYLFTVNTQAWITRGGVTVYGSDHFVPPNSYTQKIIHVTPVHGGITLLVYAGVVLLIALVLFRRRDIS